MGKADESQQERQTRDDGKGRNGTTGKADKRQQERQIRDNRKGR